MGLSSSTSKTSQQSTTTPNVPSFIADPYKSYASNVGQANNSLLDGVFKTSGTAGNSWQTYLDKNPDVAAAAAKSGQDPLAFAQQHYSSAGVNENRDGAPGGRDDGGGSQTTEFNPDALKQVATPTAPLQTQAFDAASKLAPNAAIQQGIDMTGLLGNVDPTDLSKYLNPYTDTVVDRTLSDLDRSRQQTITAGQDAATKAGAYGGSRHGVADSLTNEAFAKQAGDTAATLRDTGYTNAQGAQQTDLANKRSVAQQLISSGLLSDENIRNLIGTQGTQGETQYEQAQAQNPTNILLKLLAAQGGLLGQIPTSTFTGSTGSKTETTTGSPSMLSSITGLLGGLGNAASGLGDLGWNPLGAKL